MAQETRPARIGRGSLMVVAVLLLAAAIIALLVLPSQRGEPILSLAPGSYEVVQYSLGEREVMVLIKLEDVEGPAKYFSFPRDIVVINNTRLVDVPRIELIKARGFTKLTLFIDP